jgi:ubiquinone/menaquinone biosynthesis C-methylase UbiE
MKGITDTTYGNAIADIYDDMHGIPPGDAVETIASLAPNGGRVLELGIGTGRVALPLAARGLEVTGIDVSDAMLDKMRTKPGGDRIRIVKGDFASTHAGEDFSVAFVAFNTFFALTTLEKQKACFANVSKQLKRGGAFALECFVPDPVRFEGGQALRTGHIGVDHVVLEATRHDRNAQLLDAQLVVISTQGTRLIPLELRYCYPTELDLMAELAGLRLRERFASWSRAPFTQTSMNHVSIYEKV